MRVPNCSCAFHEALRQAKKEMFGWRWRWVPATEDVYARAIDIYWETKDKKWGQS